MEAFLNSKNHQYLQIKKLLEKFLEVIQSESGNTDVDEIMVNVYPFDFKEQFRDEEFVTVYRFLDAIADAKEHEFKFLFNLSKINYSFANAVNDLGILINALDQCISKNDLLAHTDIYKKIKIKVS